MLDREEFEKIFRLDLVARHLPDDGRVLLQVPVRQRAVLDRVAAGREGNGAGGRIALEDVRDDGLAHRLRPGAGAGDGAMTKLQSHSTSNPTSIAQKAAVEALRGPQESVGIMLAEYRKRARFRG